MYENWNKKGFFVRIRFVYRVFSGKILVKNIIWREVKNKIEFLFVVVCRYEILMVVVY